MKPLCRSSEPVEGVIENGKPSSFMARDSAAWVGSLPRKKTCVSIDMALDPSAAQDGTKREQSQVETAQKRWARHAASSEHRRTTGHIHTVIAAISRSQSAAARVSPASGQRPRSPRAAEKTPALLRPCDHLLSQTLDDRVVQALLLHARPSRIGCIGICAMYCRRSMRISRANFCHSRKGPGRAHQNALGRGTSCHM